MLPVKPLRRALLLGFLAAGCGSSPRARAVPDATLTEQRRFPSEPSAPAAPNEHGVEPSSSPRAELARPEPAESPAATPKAPLPLPEGTTVLHIGDSFAGALGIDLNKALKEVGIRGVLKYETSSYIPTWAWSKDLDRYLWSFKPDLVLVTLGANELEVPDPTQRIPAIQRLVERIGDRPCVWVAPPLWDGARDALLAVLKENIEPCVYLDSGSLVPDLPRARDGIHPSMEARKVWAEAVLDWLARHRAPTAERPWAVAD